MTNNEITYKIDDEKIVPNYINLPEELNTELKIMAAKRKTTKKRLIILLLQEALK